LDLTIQYLAHALSAAQDLLHLGSRFKRRAG
jgi:hypothetical protein